MQDLKDQGNAYWKREVMRLFPLSPKFTMNAMQVNADYSTALDITRTYVIFHGSRILQQH